MGESDPIEALIVFLIENAASFLPIEPLTSYRRPLLSSPLVPITKEPSVSAVDSQTTVEQTPVSQLF